MYEKLAALPLAALLLAGCSAPASAPAPTVTVTVTVTQPAVTVTATPPAAPKGAGPLALGKSGTSSTGSTITVYAHKKNVEPQDPDQEAIDVKVCVGAKPANATPEDYPVIGNSPWAIYDGQDRRYESARTTWSHEGAQPGYPIEQRVNWGDCVRGWVIIQGGSSTIMTKVRYTNNDTILEWKLP
jgi:hypothetical protein